MKQTVDQLSLFPLPQDRPAEACRSGGEESTVPEPAHTPDVPVAAPVESWTDILSSYVGAWHERP